MDGHHYNEQVSGGRWRWKRSRMKQNSLHTLKRVVTRDISVVTKNLIWVACAAPETMEMFRPLLLLRAMSGPWPCSSRGLGECLCPMLPPEAMRISLIWASTWSHVNVPGLCELSRAGPTPHLQPGACAKDRESWLWEPESRKDGLWHLTGHGTQESGPAPHLDSTVEVALMVWSWPTPTSTPLNNCRST